MGYLCRLLTPDGEYADVYVLFRGGGRSGCFCTASARVVAATPWDVGNQNGGRASAQRGLLASVSGGDTWRSLTLLCTSLAKHVPFKCIS